MYDFRHPLADVTPPLTACNAALGFWLWDHLRCRLRGLMTQAFSLFVFPVFADRAMRRACSFAAEARL